MSSHARPDCRRAGGASGSAVQDEPTQPAARPPRSRPDDEVRATRACPPRTRSTRTDQPRRPPGASSGRVAGGASERRTGARPPSAAVNVSLRSSKRTSALRSSSRGARGGRTAVASAVRTGAPLRRPSDDVSSRPHAGRVDTEIRHRSTWYLVAAERDDGVLARTGRVSPRSRVKAPRGPGRASHCSARPRRAPRHDSQDVRRIVSVRSPDVALRSRLLRPLSYDTVFKSFVDCRLVSCARMKLQVG